MCITTWVKAYHVLLDNDWPINDRAGKPSPKAAQRMEQLTAELPPSDAPKLSLSLPTGEGDVPTYEPTTVDLERAIRAVRLRTGESEVRRLVALDELELQAKRDG